MFLWKFVKNRENTAPITSEPVRCAMLKMLQWWADWFGKKFAGWPRTCLYICSNGLSESRLVILSWVGSPFKLIRELMMTLCPVFGQRSVDRMQPVMHAISNVFLFHIIENFDPINVWGAKKWENEHQNKIFVMSRLSVQNSKFMGVQ